MYLVDAKLIIMLICLILMVLYGTWLPLLVILVISFF